MIRCLIGRSGVSCRTPVCTTNDFTSFFSTEQSLEDSFTFLNILGILNCILAMSYTHVPLFDTRKLSTHSIVTSSTELTNCLSTVYNKLDKINHVGLWK